MTNIVTFAPRRARSEAERFCLRQREITTRELEREAAEQRRIDALRAFDEAERRRVQETY